MVSKSKPRQPPLVPRKDWHKLQLEQLMCLRNDGTLSLQTEATPFCKKYVNVVSQLNPPVATANCSIDTYVLRWCNWYVSTCGPPIEESLYSLYVSLDSTDNMKPLFVTALTVLTCNKARNRCCLPTDILTAQTKLRTFPLTVGGHHWLIKKKT